MSIVSIHQPCYIPYLGIFYKVWKSDKFIYLDDAQYSNGYVFEWNRIKTPQGVTRLKIPLERKFGDLLTEVKPKNYLGWKEKHLKTIEMNYRRAPYFSDFFETFKDCLMSEYRSLAELNIALMNLIVDWFGWNKLIYRTSEMRINCKAESRVIEAVKRVDGNVYLSGIGGKHYQTQEHFTEAGIRLEYSHYVPLEYRQQWGAFRPDMSVLDYILNEGRDIENLFERIEGGK